MRSTLTILVAILSLLVPGLAVPAFAQYSPRDAEPMCRDQIRGQYNANARGLTTNDRGGGRYAVSGNADRNSETAWFTCQVGGGGVRNIDMGNWSRKSNDNSGAIAAVGAAVLLGAIIAAASSKKKSHEYDRYDDNYQGGNQAGYSPANGIYCNRDQHACYDRDNHYSPNWSSREFNY